MDEITVYQLFSMINLLYLDGVHLRRDQKTAGQSQGRIAANFGSFNWTLRHSKLFRISLEMFPYRENPESREKFYMGL